MTMKLSARRMFVRTAVAVAAGLVLAAVAAPMASPAPTAPAASVTSTVDHVTLVTGDQIMLTAAQNPASGMLHTVARSGVGKAVFAVTMGGRSYAVPAVALPYLDRGLDRSLFDLRALEQQETGGQIPLEIVYPNSRPTLPGVTWTGARTGYLTTASARTFGAALAAQYVADRTGAGHRSLTGAVTSIALAGAASGSRPVQPNFAMHTLTVNGIDAAGRPDEGDVVFLQNVDDSARYLSGQVFFHGQARFSVPSGRYFAISAFLTVTASGDLTDARLVANTEFDVRADGPVLLDARTATEPITMTTPRPATVAESGFLLQRDPKVGTTFALEAEPGPGVPLRIAPVPRAVSVGQLHSSPFQRLESPAGASPPYTYRLEHDAAGVIPPERFTEQPGDLATLDSAFYSDVATADLPGPAGRYAYGLYPWVGHAVDTLQQARPTTLPERRLEYLTGDPRIAWRLTLAKFDVQGTGPFEGLTSTHGIQVASLRSLHGGEALTENWDQAPLHPGNPGDPQHLEAGYQPAATRSGDTISLAVQGFGDNEQGHAGAGFVESSPNEVSGTYAIYQGEELVDSGSPSQKTGLVAQATVGPASSSLRVVLDTARTGPAYPLSTSTHTEWTWVSGHRDPSVLLPFPNWVCAASDETPNRACTVEPLMAVQYLVHGLSLADTAAPGPALLDLNVAHLAGATVSAVTEGTVQVSYDDGATWQDATVTGQDGRFVASYVNPAGGYVALRVTASDATGGHFAETIHRAYSIEEN
jgi:hypothetical protein